MSSDQQIPLTRVRGVGPTAAGRMAQCGINTVGQLANMSIAEFKLTCPALEKRAEAFVKGARRLLKRLGPATGITTVSDTTLPGDEGPGAADLPSRVVAVQVGEADQIRKKKKAEKSSEPAVTSSEKRDKGKKDKKSDDDLKQKKKKEKEKKKKKKEKEKEGTSDTAAKHDKDKKKSSDKKKETGKGKSSGKKGKKEKNEKKTRDKKG